MEVISPQGFEYRYDPNARRLARRTREDQPWATFSIHHMSAEELRFVAGVIDEARSHQARLSLIQGVREAQEEQAKRGRTVHPRLRTLPTDRP